MNIIIWVLAISGALTVVLGNAIIELSKNAKKFNIGAKICVLGIILLIIDVFFMWLSKI